MSLEPNTVEKDPNQTKLSRSQLNKVKVDFIGGQNGDVVLPCGDVISRSDYDSIAGNLKEDESKED